MEAKRERVWMICLYPSFLYCGVSDIFNKMNRREKKKGFPPDLGD